MFDLSMIVLFQSFPARSDDVRWCSPGFLAEHFQDHDGVSIDAVDDSPILAVIANSQFMATCPDRRQGPRMRHGQRFAVLQQAEPESGRNPRLLRKRRRLDLSLQPDQGLIAQAHVRSHYMSKVTYKVSGYEATDDGELK